MKKKETKILYQLVKLFMQKSYEKWNLFEYMPNSMMEFLMLT
jgi:hypothetical protein